MDMLMSILRRSPRSLKAFTKEIRALNLPAFSETELSVAFLRSLPNEDAQLEIPCEQIRRAYRRHVATLEEYGALESAAIAPDLTAYQLPTTKLPAPEQLICIFDPFCYLSHLSALAWHGLSERLPKTVFVSRPSRSQWQALASIKLDDRLGDWSRINSVCKLSRYQFRDYTRIGNHAIHFWTSSRLDREYSSAFKNIKDQHIRVATIGRCFLDMVRSPDLCGGIHHVIDIYSEHSATYLDLILKEIDSFGNKIEKARAGYLLESSISTDQPVLSQWLKTVSRGGSRKLDPSADYSERFSERWGLSLNV